MRAAISARFLPIALSLGLLAACSPKEEDTADPGDTADTGDTGETGDTSDTADTADTGDTGDTSDTSDTGDTGDTSDTGDPDAIVSTFTCTETSVVEPYMRLLVTGGFTADSRPRNLHATYVSSGATDFEVAAPERVSAKDPYYEEILYWESALSMLGWDVNVPGDPSGDARYFFIPDGAEGISIFDAFYYHIYGAGGNGQFEFSCERDDP